MAKLIYYAELRELTGKLEETAGAEDIKSCLRYIQKAYGREAYAQAKRSLITVNGKSILALGNFRAKVEEEDEVRFLPICGGG